MKVFALLPSLACAAAQLALLWLFGLGLGLGAVPVAAAAQQVQNMDAGALDRQLRSFTLQSLQPLPDINATGAARTGNPQKAAPRIEVEVGTLDPRLKLAPCHNVEPHLPPGAKLWGRSRIGLRCTDGPVRWNVFLPITVKAWSPSLVAADSLAAGTVLKPEDLRLADVDLAAEPSPAITQPALAVGRALARPLTAGDSLRQTDLRPRSWFAAGDTVTVVATGPGYAITGEGQALNPGLEGMPVRVRTEGGRVIVGTAVADRRVEVAL